MKAGRGLAVTACALLLLGACGGGSDPLETDDVRPISGSQYFVGTITPLAGSAPDTTDVPKCPTDPNAITYEPAGTPLPFKGESVSAGLAIDFSDADLIVFTIVGYDFTNDRRVTLTTLPFRQSEMTPVPNTGTLAPAYVLPADKFVASVDLEYESDTTGCTTTNIAGGRALLFLDDRGTQPPYAGPPFAAADETAQIAETTTVLTTSGNVRILEGTAFAGCVKAILQNNYTEGDAPAVDRFSRVCLNACFRVRISQPGGGIGVDTAVATCPAGGCAACP